VWKSALRTGEWAIAADDGVAVVRAAYEAYGRKNRAAIKRLIDLHFRSTSPVENRIDRTTYLARCWPSSDWIKGFDFINLVRDGERVFVTYEGWPLPQYRSPHGARRANRRGLGLFRLDGPAQGQARRVPARRSGAVRGSADRRPGCRSRKMFPAFIAPSITTPRRSIT
jgi:hypothetical protein